MSQTLLKRLFYFIIIFTPLAFGTVEPWSYAVMEIGIAAAALLLVYQVHRGKRILYQVPGSVILVLFLAYILFQVIPLPQGLVKLLSPGAHAIHQTSAYLTGNDSSWMTLSVYPKATVSEFFRYGSYIVFFIISIQLLTDKETLKTTVLIIVVFGALLAFSSILQHYVTQDRALWFRKVPSASIFGPYINRNHYAGLMEMIFPVTLGLFFFYRPRLTSTSLFKGIAEIFSQEKANIHILIGCGCLLMATSIFVSLSRSGIICCCLSLIIFTFLMLKRRVTRGKTMMVIGIAVAIVLSVSWFGWDGITGRFGQLQEPENSFTAGRQVYWQDSGHIVKNFVLTGTGFGTFRNIYPSYQTADIQNMLTHAHNDYIELASEAGAAGVILVLVFAVFCLPPAYRMFNQRRDAFSIYLYMGSITGITAILFHSMTDFNLHIGANGLWFAFMAALMVSAAYTNIQRQHAIPTRLGAVEPGMKKNILSLALSLFALLAVFYNISHFMGTVYYNGIKDYRMSVRSGTEELDTVYTVAARAEKFDPLDGKYPFTQGLAAWFKNDPENTRRHFDRAITIDPLNSAYLERYGFFRSRAGDRQIAGKAFEKATSYDISNAERWLNYGAWLLINKEKEAGIEVMKKALALDETKVDKVLTSMTIAGLSFEEMEAAIPMQPSSAIAFAKFTDDTGQRKEAVQRYLEALELTASTEPVDRRSFIKIYRFFYGRNDLKNAAGVIERAEASLPDDAGIKVIHGDLLYKQGVLFKAKEKYEQALILDPKNKGALRRLQRFTQ